MDHRCRGSHCAHRSSGATALHGGTRALRQSRLSRRDDRQAALLARTLLKSRPRMRWRIYGMASLLLLSAVIGGARPETDARSPAFTKVPELVSGFHLLYTQNFAEGRKKFADWESQHPDEPFGQVAVAASYLFEEMYRQGVLSSNGIECRIDSQERTPGSLEAAQGSQRACQGIARAAAGRQRCVRCSGHGQLHYRKPFGR